MIKCPTNCQGAKLHGHALIFYNNLRQQSICTVISFLMCQRRQWLPENFSWLSSCSATSSATGFLPITGECGKSEFCRPLLESLCNARSERDANTSDKKLCFIKSPFLKKTKHSLPIYISPLCRDPFLSGLRETLAFDFLPRHFLLVEKENREKEEKRALTPQSSIFTKKKIPPSWTSIHRWDLDENTHHHTAPLWLWLQHVSHTLLVRHSSTPTLTFGLSFKLKVPLPVHCCFHTSSWKKKTFPHSLSFNILYKRILFKKKR